MLILATVSLGSKRCDWFIGVSEAKVAHTKSGVAQASVQNAHPLLLASSLMKEEEALSLRSSQ
jgi:hypothetical protein